MQLGEYLSDPLCCPKPPGMPPYDMNPTGLRHSERARSIACFSDAG
jgi:hypothetical protein